VISPTWTKKDPDRTWVCGRGSLSRPSFAEKKALVFPRLLRSNVEGCIWTWGSLDNQEHPVVRSAKANCAAIAILINSGFVGCAEVTWRAWFSTLNQGISIMNGDGNWKEKKGRDTANLHERSPGSRVKLSWLTRFEDVETIACGKARR
jgi:hypothetical protein